MADDQPPKGYECPAWLLTYGDMTTLLVTFFVMLISLSTINVNKYKEVMKKVQSNMGVGGEQILEGSKKPFETEVKPSIDINEMQFPPIKMQEQNETEKFEDDAEWYKFLSDFVTKNELKNFIDIEEIKIGYILKIPIDICFERGESILTWEADNILKKLSFVLGKVRGKIIVDTNVGGFEWQRIIAQRDLLLDRAESICNYLLSFEDVEPSRVAISGKRLIEMKDAEKIAIIVLKKTM